MGKDWLKGRTRYTVRVVYGDGIGYEAVQSRFAKKAAMDTLRKFVKEALRSASVLDRPIYSTVMTRLDNLDQAVFNGGIMDEPCVIAGSLGCSALNYSIDVEAL